MASSIVEKIDLLMGLTPTTANLNFSSNLHALIHATNSENHQIITRELQTRVQNSVASTSVRNDGLVATREYKALLADLTATGSRGALVNTLGREAVRDLRDEGLLRTYRDGRLAGIQKLGMLVLKRRTVDEVVEKCKGARRKEARGVIALVVDLLESMLREEEIAVKLFDVEVRNRKPFAGAGT